MGQIPSVIQQVLNNGGSVEPSLIRHSLAATLQRAEGFFYQATHSPEFEKLRRQFLSAVTPPKVQEPKEPSVLFTLPSIDINGTPRQIVMPAISFTMPTIDVTAMMNTVLKDMGQTPFNPQKPNFVVKRIEEALPHAQILGAGSDGTAMKFSKGPLEGYVLKTQHIPSAFSHSPIEKTLATVSYHIGTIQPKHAEKLVNAMEQKHIMPQEACKDLLSSHILSIQPIPTKVPKHFADKVGTDIATIVNEKGEVLGTLMKEMKGKPLYPDLWRKIENPTELLQDVKHTASIPQEHFNELIALLQALKQKGISVDFRNHPNNLLYDAETGFKIIDIDEKGQKVVSDPSASMFDVLNVLKLCPTSRKELILKQQEGLPSVQQCVQGLNQIPFVPEEWKQAVGAVEEVMKEGVKEIPQLVFKETDAYRDYRIAAHEISKKFNIALKHHNIKDTRLHTHGQK
jgi:hypothetical protein